MDRGLPALLVAPGLQLPCRHSPGPSTAMMPSALCRRGQETRRLSHPMMQLEQQHRRRPQVCAHLARHLGQCLCAQSGVPQGKPPGLEVGLLLGTALQAPSWQAVTGCLSTKDGAGYAARHLDPAHGQLGTSWGGSWQRRPVVGPLPHHFLKCAQCPPSRGGASRMKRRRGGERPQ